MIELIHRHYHRPITLGELAAMLQMNADYLAHLFSLNVGTTFTRYLLELRLTRAKELLRDPRARVCEVAAAVGFASADHFRHVCKARIGQAPSACGHQFLELETADCRGTPPLGKEFAVGEFGPAVVKWLS